MITINDDVDSDVHDDNDTNALIIVLMMSWGENRCNYKLTDTYTLYTQTLQVMLTDSTQIKKT